MRLSTRGLDILKEFEGLALEPYKDVAGYETIGYGHKLHPGESFGRISKADAEALLMIDLNGIEQGVWDLLSHRQPPVTQGQFDALVVFAFNVGLAALRKSTLLVKTLHHDATAADEFKRWVHAGGKVHQGLVRRREAERRLFMG